MQFDPSTWTEFPVGFSGITAAPLGSLKVNCSMPCSLWVSQSAEDDESGVLVGYGHSFDVDLVGAGECFFWLEGPAIARAFLHWPRGRAREARPGSFTNPDRPFSDLSESMSAVLDEVRRFQVNQTMQMRAFQRDARLREERRVSAARAEERKALQAAAAPAQAPDQALDQAPDQAPAEAAAEAAKPNPAKPPKAPAAE